jgi:hypothetical protein
MKDLYFIFKHLKTKKYKNLNSEQYKFNVKILFLSFFQKEIIYKPATTSLRGKAN